MKIMLINFYVVIIVVLILNGSLFAEEVKISQQLEATKGVVSRLIPSGGDCFKFEAIKKVDGKDVFELESVNGKIIVSGSSGVAICSGVNWYLKYYCNLQFDWFNHQIKLPKVLPLIQGKIRKETPYKYRYYFNYCTFSYTMAFWDWKRWEQEIDWMALNGINSPLAITGQEAIWQKVYRKMGFVDSDIKKFIVGPAYFGWGWMGNVDGWGGPLPQSWLDYHLTLQQKILKRQRELGMTPILPAFTGHVPATMKKKFPKAKIQRMRSWGGFPGTYVLDPMDPLFKQIGSEFIKEQTNCFGTDHLYTADTFNELNPPSGDEDYLKNVSRIIYDSVAQEDPKATIVIQGWMFLHGNFWNNKRIKAFLDGVPNENMLILDLFSAAKPQWSRTAAYYGKPWVWCMLHNWGGKQGMYGRSKQIAEDLPKLLNNNKAGKLSGIGITAEGLHTNPVIYDLMAEMTWHKKPVDREEWIKKYIVRRYEKVSEEANKAWAILLKTLYSCTTKRHGPQGAHWCMRPTHNFSRSSFVRSELFYKASDIKLALKHLLNAAPLLKDSPKYQYDLVDLTRQMMSDLSIDLHRKMGVAYKSNDLKKIQSIKKIWLGAILDLDELLGTRKEFLLGKWLEDAKSLGNNAKEKALYEWNARTQITLWGAKNSQLHDYAQKQWSGMMKDFYYQRWKIMFDEIENAWKSGKKYDSRVFNDKVKKFEESWAKLSKLYPTKPTGNPITVAKKIFSKYCN